MPPLFNPPPPSLVVQCQWHSTIQNTTELLNCPTFLFYNIKGGCIATFLATSRRRVPVIKRFPSRSQRPCTQAKARAKDKVNIKSRGYRHIDAGLTPHSVLHWPASLLCLLLYTHRRAFIIPYHHIKPTPSPIRRLRLSPLQRRFSLRLRVHLGRGFHCCFHCLWPVAAGSPLRVALFCCGSSLPRALAAAPWCSPGWMEPEVENTWNSTEGGSP